MSGWIGVDLDGTLAEFNGWVDDGGIGKPVPLMLKKVKKLLSEGHLIKIFTARAPYPQQIRIIQDWLEENGLPILEITNVKDLDMILLYDDRCVQIIKNTGEPVIQCTNTLLRKLNKLLSRKVKCSRCNGTGVIPGYDTITFYPTVTPCPDCQEGYIINE
ncbi:MAG: hypothetical protein WC479_00775 [Candidatus Izemoplasmatales bacterium]